jgi:hypothetical protein|tara:strand:- start:299 stop:718 length:420 start_codon:yes stop_codon:yes gene_type:complete
LKPKKPIDTSYFTLLGQLRPKDQAKINDKVIWAAMELEWEELGKWSVGTKAHIESRAKQLIIDWKREGWAKAYNRFKVAIIAQKPSVEEGSKEAIHPLPDHMIMDMPVKTTTNRDILTELEELGTFFTGFPPIPEFLRR